MIPPRLLFDAQLCNTITPASRVSAFHSYDRSCETRESRGRAQLPVTARCYSILELGLRFSIPFLATFSLKFESLSKSGGSMRRKRRIVVDRESGLFKSGSRKSSRILIKFLQGETEEISRRSDPGQRDNSILYFVRYLSLAITIVSKLCVAQVRRQHSFPNKWWTWSGRGGRD